MGELSEHLQEASGVSDEMKSQNKKLKKLIAEKSQIQFYDRIDRTFRIWLREIDFDNKDSCYIDEYPQVLEKELYRIAERFGGELAAQNNINTIFGRKRSDQKDKKPMSTASALNIYIAALKKIFNKEGGEKNG